MHESSIAVRLVEAALEAAPAASIRAVTVRVGELSGVAPEALHFAFDVARQGTPLERAALHIETSAVAVYCPACGSERATRLPELFRCPVCGRFPCDLVRGRELDLISLEVEEP